MNRNQMAVHLVIYIDYEALDMLRDELSEEFISRVLIFESTCGQAEHDWRFRQ